MATRLPSVNADAWLATAATDGKYFAIIVSSYAKAGEHTPPPPPIPGHEVTQCI